MEHSTVYYVWNMIPCLPLPLSLTLIPVSPSPSLSLPISYSPLLPPPLYLPLSLSLARPLQIKEMFGAGTACVVCPVDKIVFLDEVKYPL